LFPYNETLRWIVDDIDRLKQKAKQNQSDSAWLVMDIVLYLNSSSNQISPDELNSLFTSFGL